HPYFLTESHLFYEGAPADTVRFALEAPPGWQVRSAWLRAEGPPPSTQGNLHTWEIRNLPEPEEDPLGIPPEDRAPLLAVNLLPAPGTPTSAAVFSDWMAVSKWYESLSQSRREVTPAVSEAARKAASGAGEEFVPKIAALAKWVRDQVRYVAVE